MWSPVQEKGRLRTKVWGECCNLSEWRGGVKDETGKKSQAKETTTECIEIKSRGQKSIINFLKQED